MYNKSTSCLTLYKIVAQKDEDIKNYVAGAKACVKGKEDAIKLLKSEIKKLEKNVIVYPRNKLITTIKALPRMVTVKAIL